jgi:hypothetical protein
MNHQGNINGAVYLPECGGNAQSKTNQKMLV